MRFGRKVHDDVGALDERAADRVVEDVAVDERVARMVHDVVQVFASSGIGQLVERGDTPVRMWRSA